MTDEWTLKGKKVLAAPIHTKTFDNYFSTDNIETLHKKLINDFRLFISTKLFVDKYIEYEEQNITIDGKKIEDKINKIINKRFGVDKE